VVLQLLILGLVIALAPLTVAAFILIAGSEKGTRKGAAFILGWIGTLVVVIAAVLASTGGDPPRPHTAPSNAVLVVKALLGVLLIAIGYREWRRSGRPRKQPQWMARLDHMSLSSAAGLGAFLQPWSLVAAGAAVVSQAKLSTAGDWLALIFFCLIATSSFLVIELYTAFAPDAAHARLDLVRKWIDGHTEQAIVAGSLVVGGWLLADSIYVLVS
jgi:Sap, sulfolipid-1-addressing protein